MIISIKKIEGHENKGCFVFVCSIRIEKLSISDIFFLALTFVAFDKPFPAANSHIAAHSLKQLEAAWQLTARR